MKHCFKCGTVKPINEFYLHPAMADGHLGKCIVCTRRDVAAYRRLHRERIRAYQRVQASKPHNRLRDYIRHRRWRDADRRRPRCHCIAQRHYRKAPTSCQQCGGHIGRLERHHDDYNFPLLIRWLCKQCHVQADKERRLQEARHESF
jgi:hypothetical protein